MDSRVQERKQQALKKHPLAVKLDINCKGLTQNTSISIKLLFRLYENRVRELLLQHCMSAVCIFNQRF